jgi:hypothetical protein
MAGYTHLGYKNNLDIMKELICNQSIMEFIKNYRCDWKNGVLQMPHSRIPFQILHYQPKGQRFLGRPCCYWHNA